MPLHGIKNSPWNWEIRALLISVISMDSLNLASLVAQTVKCLPAMWETQVLSLGREDPVQKEMTTHSSTLAWEMSWTEEPGRLQSMGSQE